MRLPTHLLAAVDAYINRQPDPRPSRSETIRQILEDRFVSEGLIERSEEPSTAAQSIPKICPECQHAFQGHGWDGIDAHWKSKHETVMRYAEAWPLIRDGKYPAK